MHAPTAQYKTLWVSVMYITCKLGTSVASRRFVVWSYLGEAKYSQCMQWVCLALRQYSAEAIVVIRNQATHNHVWWGREEERQEEREHIQRMGGRQLRKL